MNRSTLGEAPSLPPKVWFKTFGPERIRDAPISEAGFVGAAVGAALTGLRPVVDLMYFDFVTVAYDQLLSNAAKSRYMFGGQTKVPLTLFAEVGRWNWSRRAAFRKFLFHARAHPRTQGRGAVGPLHG